MKTKKPATLADVARHARVSTATASRVLHNTGPVSHDLRKKIAASVSALGYVPHRFSKPRNQGTIALLVEDLLNPYFPEIIRGVQEEATNVGAILTLYNLTDQPQHQQQLVQKLAKQPLEGIIITGSSPFPELLEWHEHHQVPMVIINRQVSQPGIHCIKVDFENAMYRATQHLLSLNHTRIGHLASPVTGEIEQSRQRGIELALKEAGLTLRPEWCPIVSPGAEVEGGYQAMRVILDLPVQNASDGRDRVQRYYRGRCAPRGARGWLARPARYFGYWRGRHFDRGARLPAADDHRPAQVPHGETGGADAAPDERGENADRQ